MSLVDYGHRGVPNVFLTAPLQSDGHVERGALQEQGVRHAVQAVHRGARDRVAGQKTIAGKIENAAARPDADHLPYFYNYLTATATGVSGVEPTAIGHLFLFNASKA